MKEQLEQWEVDEAVFEAQSELLAARALGRIHVRTDRMFALLMALQFAAAAEAAFVLAPQAGAGAAHLHAYAAVALAGLFAGLPILLAWRRPGTVLSRHAVAVCQVLFSSLFIHLSGGRIETHFHVFGSLAFLAFYRDWKVLVPATAVVAADHLVRGVFWPESVFGVAAAAPWRALEHVGWVLFCDVFLVYSCVTSAREIHATAERETRLSLVNATIERSVRERTQELNQQTEALTQEIEERHRLESQLVQAQKLESIGQLAAGIAHEINTPAQYVSHNTQFLQQEFGGFIEVLDRYAAQLDPDAPPRSWPERAQEIRATLEDMDYEFTREEVPRAIAQSLEGLERISEIISAMKDFSHPGSDHLEPADLNRAIESTVTVCRNRWRDAAQVRLNLAPGLPAVPCLLGEFNQVILNLVVNAADAIESHRSDTQGLGVIEVSTRLAGEFIEVEVSDNGGGMPEEVRAKIFDPFFTTKEVGKGTGQGLAISRDVVVQKHGGELTCLSDPEQGTTTFLIRLPLAGRPGATKPGVESAA